MVPGPHRGRARGQLRRGERAGRTAGRRGEPRGAARGAGARHLHLRALALRRRGEVPLDGALLVRHLRRHSPRLLAAF